MSIICPHCGAVLQDHSAFAAHYKTRHRHEPFLEANDTPLEDEGGRSWGGTDPTDSDRPLNVFEEVMEETPEDTAEEDAQRREGRAPAA
jgi:hypothetical protein